MGFPRAGVATAISAAITGSTGTNGTHLTLLVQRVDYTHTDLARLGHVTRILPWPSQRRAWEKLKKQNGVPV